MRGVLKNHPLSNQQQKKQVRVAKERKSERGRGRMMEIERYTHAFNGKRDIFATTDIEFGGIASMKKYKKDESYWNVLKRIDSMNDGLEWEIG